MLSTALHDPLQASHLTLATADELQYAVTLKSQVAPLLAQGVARALNERPTDAAAFLAEHVVRAHPNDPALAEAFQRRRLHEEAVYLEAELAQLRTAGDEVVKDTAACAGRGGGAQAAPKR